LVHAAALEFLQFVAQRGDAGRGQIGLVQGLGKVIARVGFKGHDAAGHAAVCRFAAQEGQHSLVATVHTIEVADGEGAGGGQLWVVKTAKNLHGMAGVWGVRDAGQRPFVTVLNNTERIL
jgi:hypothetical protein